MPCAKLKYLFAISYSLPFQSSSQLLNATKYGCYEYQRQIINYRKSRQFEDQGYWCLNASWASNLSRFFMIARSSKGKDTNLPKISSNIARFSFLTVSLISFNYNKSSNFTSLKHNVLPCGKFRRGLANSTYLIPAKVISGK